MPTARAQLLLSPAEYFKLADQALRSCPYRLTDIDGPKINRDSSVYIFSGKIELEGDFRLKFTETSFRESPNQLVRAIDYDFRRSGTKNEIFRFDNHGDTLDLGKPCHLHVNGSSRIYEGDTRLNGYSLIDIHLLDVVGLVCKFIRGEKLPWQ